MNKRAWVQGVRCGSWMVAAVCLGLVAGCGNFFKPETSSTGTGGSGGSGGSGGGTGGGTSTGSGYFYAANSNISLDTIAAFSFNGTTLTALQNAPYPIQINPTAMAITPNNDFLYVASNEGGMYAYTLTSGVLATANNGIAVDSSDIPQAIAIDPTGQYLLMQQLTTTGSVVSVFSINQTTAALTVVGTPLTFGQGGAGQIYFVPNTDLVYLTEGSGGADAMSFNPVNGSLISLNQHLALLPNGSADFNVVSDPQGKYLYVSETGTNVIREFTINATTGALTGNGTVAPGLGPNALLVDATGAHLYVALRGAAQVAAYNLSATGTLSEISGSPYATGSFPNSLAEDHSGGYILVGNEAGNPDFQVFAIGSATSATPGGLTSVTTANTGGSVEPGEVSVVVATH